MVCEGKFELWWVQRTRWGFIVQFKKNMTVVAPPCDYDVPYDKKKIISTAPVQDATAASKAQSGGGAPFQPLHRH